MDIVNLARELIAADTVSHKGTAAAVKVLRPLYEAAGLAVQVQEERRGGALQQNLVGTYAGRDKAGLLLVTHLDTVDPGPLELWTETAGNPYALTQRGDQLFGLGSADTKLDALCKLWAAREFRDRPLARSLQLLGTFEEEVGGRGAKHFVRKGDFAARFVACSEPSELTIIRAHKGYAVVALHLELPPQPELNGPFETWTVDGRAAHSSTPHLGENAIDKTIARLGARPFCSLDAGTVANKVPARCQVVCPGPGREAPRSRQDARPALELARELFSAWKSLALAQEPRVNPAFDPERCVVNWGVARLCGPSAELVFDCRLLPGHDPDALTRSFEQKAQELATTRRAKLRVMVDRASPAMELREPSALLEAARAACREVGLPDEPQAKPTNTEAGIFARAGAEAIVFGPGRSTGNAHCANEHNLLSQLERAIPFHRALIARLCL